MHTMRSTGFLGALKGQTTEKIFNTVGILHAPAFVSFRDHFNSGATCKRNRPVSVPNPEYIRIHAAIAGILNMSGAGKFFDELLDKYNLKDDEGKVPLVQSWPELGSDGGRRIEGVCC